jgi:hypothetical protein
MSFIGNIPEARALRRTVSVRFEGGSIRKTLRTTTAKINRRFHAPGMETYA